MNPTNWKAVPKFPRQGKFITQYYENMHFKNVKFNLIKFCNKINFREAFIVQNYISVSKFTYTL